MRGTNYVDRSGSVTTGGASQTLASANTARKYLRVSNPSSASESLFVNDKGANASTSDGKSVELLPGVIFDWGGSPPMNAVTVTAATSGHVFEAVEG